MLRGGMSGTPLSQSDANKLCSCIVRGVMEEYSVAQLQALDAASDAQRKPFDKHLDKVAAMCQEKFKAGPL